MAIQLNDRDYQIFKLLDEHQALLEKHIAWFVAPEDKPVLIRDRLRKLFYLDYLLCQRHDSKLAWWSTPTKPLVYMLAPLARTVSGARQNSMDIYDNEWQRDHLEIANIRMIFLIAQKEGLLKTCDWQTHMPINGTVPIYDALISCAWQSHFCKIGLISHPEFNSATSDRLSQALSKTDIHRTIIISRDESHQNNLQTLLLELPDKTNLNSVLLATHQDLYRSGLSKVSWYNAFGQRASFLDNDSFSGWNADFGTINVASA